MKKFLAIVMAAVLLCSTFSFTFAETVTSCDNGHDFTGNEKVTKTEPTCTEKGLSTQKCNRCGKDIEDDIPAKGHVDADKPLEIKGENCGDEIIEVYAKCDVCGTENFTKSKGFIQHEYDKDTATNFKKVEPTCTEDGYTEYYCIRNGCGFPQRVPGDKALGHDWKIADNGMVDATCYAQGKSGQYIYCDRCKLHAADDFIDANGNGVLDAGELSVDAHYTPALSHDTETKFGKDFVDVFFVYDATGKFVDVTPYVWKLGEGTTVLNPLAENEEYAWPLSHSAAVTVEYKAETCLEDGFITVKCACGNFERTEIIEAKGHFYHQMAIKYVDSKGETQKLFLNWEAVMSVIDKADEIEAIADFMDLNLTVEKVLQILYKLEYLQEGEMLDCTINPIVQYICVKCDDRVDGEAAACKEHHFGNAEEIEAYLEGDAPFMTGRLVKVTQLQIPEYDGNDDKTSDWEIYERGDQLEVVAKTLRGFNKRIALCTKYDVTVQCAHCAATKTFTCNTDAKHDLPKSELADPEHYIVIRKSTCTVPGLVIKHCTDDNCGFSSAENLPLDIHHADLTKTVVVAASCTEDGSRTLICKDCGYTWTEKIPSYGHDYKWVETKKASCGVEGERKLTCNRCNDVKKIEVIPEAHIVKSLDDVKAMTNINEKALFAAFTIAYKKNADGSSTMIGYNVPEILPWTDCSKDGNLQFTCINCKNVTIKHAACEHDWYNTEITDVYSKFVDDETCRYFYTQHYACYDCDQVTKKELHEDFAHEFDGDFSEVYIPTTTAPTCKDAGLAFYPCKFCGEHFVDEVPAFNHSFDTVYDAEKNAWTYVCEWCGEIETVEYAVEKYTVNTDSIVWGNKTTGTGYVTLENDVQNSFVAGQRYAFIQWTWVTKGGDNVVADTVVELKSLGKGEYSFNAKGVSVAGAVLDNVVIIITDDADAADFSCTNYGYATMKK